MGRAVHLCDEPSSCSTAIANGAIIPLPTYDVANPDNSARYTTGAKVVPTVQLSLDVTGYFAP